MEEKKKIEKVDVYWPSGIDGSNKPFDIPGEILREKLNELIDYLNEESQ